MAETDYTIRLEGSPDLKNATAAAVLRAVERMADLRGPTYVFVEAVGRVVRVSGWYGRQVRS